MFYPDTSETVIGFPDPMIRAALDELDAGGPTEQVRRLLAVEALLHVRERVRPWLDLQLVAFPQAGVLRTPGGVDLLETALDRGVDVVGGIPHFERTAAEGAESVRVLCEIAARRGLPVDMHCDETDDPQSRHIETLVFHAQRLGRAIYDSLQQPLVDALAQARDRGEIAPPDLDLLAVNVGQGDGVRCLSGGDVGL